MLDFSDRCESMNCIDFSFGFLRVCLRSPETKGVSLYLCICVSDEEAFLRYVPQDYTLSCLLSGDGQRQSVRSW